MSFIVLTILFFVSITLLFLTDSTAMEGICMSYVAAYIFYMVNDVIPSSKRRYTEKVMVYRKLQLILVKLDSIFEEVVSLNGGKKRIVDYKLDEFFSEGVLKQYLVGFDDTQDSSVVSSIQSLSRMKCFDLFQSLWSEITSYCEILCNMDCNSYNNTELVYCLLYLVNESSMSIYFKLRKKQNLAFECIIFLNDTESAAFKNSLTNIIRLHKIAHSLYDSKKEKTTQGNSL